MADGPAAACVFFEEIDSTNTEAARRAAAGEPGPLWVLALRQTAARGRRGRPWIVAEGNLFASVMLRPGGDAPALALRSFTAALALREALVDAGTPPGRLALKWPNDVLLDQGKLAGILLETADQGRALVVGFGVNLRHAPMPEVLEPGAVAPVSLAVATKVVIGPEAFLPLLAAAFARWEARFQAEGFAPLREEWLRHAARLGQPVAARLPDRTIRGVFETVDATGAIVLHTGTGRVSVHAADIQFS